MRRMGRSLILQVVLACLLACVAQVFAATEPPPRVALVNGVAIGDQEYRQELERLSRRKGDDSGPAGEAGRAALRREALDNLITRELLYQESVRQGIVIDKAALDREMGQIGTQFATPGQYEENLKRIGMSTDTVRTLVARGMAIRILIDRMLPGDTAMTDAELSAYYAAHREDLRQPARVRLSHILLTLDTGASEVARQEAREKLAAIRVRLVKGEDFALLAAERSDCLSKRKGGDLGWFSQGELAPELERAVARLKVNELSEIVEDRYGLHLVKVTGREDARIPPLDEVRDRVLARVRQDRRQAALQGYISRLRDNARVEIFLSDTK
jgi:parvulin-like peptidyl-prolyl isomerase